MKRSTLTAAVCAVCTTSVLLAGCQLENRAPSGSGESKTPSQAAGQSTGKPVRIRESNPAEPAGKQHHSISVDGMAIRPLTMPESASIAQHRLAPQRLRDQGFGYRLPAEHAVAPGQDTYRENYATLERNATVRTADEPVSTFSIDVDTGAYANVRRFLQNGQMPPAEAVRIEEMLNYFPYDYATATDQDVPFSIQAEMGPAPWNPQTHLLHVGLQGYVPADIDDKSANLVFLIDVSGSMNSPDKLGLLKSSISLLVRQLDENDSVAIVVYAGSSGTVLEPTPGNQHRKIDRALAALTAGGSTNGASGIELAYQLASDNYRPDGINRLILATDGDFNVGISDVYALKQLIRHKRESGIALTTLGFGTGNYNDHLMEQLANTGNGSYAYIDTLSEARKVLVDELQATLLTIAGDVKIQIEFNPAVVSEYRLIGYRNRVLANEDFGNDRVDAGEAGAGHSVTALYEIALHGEAGERHSPRRYGQTADVADSASVSDNPVNDYLVNDHLVNDHLVNDHLVNDHLVNDHLVNDDSENDDGEHRMSEVAELRLRYKLPGSPESRRVKQIVPLAATRTGLSASSDDFRFSASVAAFAQLLQGDDRLAAFDYEDVRTLAAGAQGSDPFAYRAEFLRLVDMADSLQRLSRLTPESSTPDES